MGRRFGHLGGASAAPAEWERERERVGRDVERRASLRRALLLALVLGGAQASRAESAEARCAVDGGVFADPVVTTLAVPAGCTVSFKAWGGGGGIGSAYGSGQSHNGGGGGFAALTRTSVEDDVYLLSVGGAGQTSCTPPSSGGAAVQGFEGGRGGANRSNGCAGGGGGGATSVALLGAVAPLLVAGGGGGSSGVGGGFNGRPGGTGPFRDGGTAGADGCDRATGVPSTQGAGAGGGGGGFPRGGGSTGGAEFCTDWGGGGGENYAPGGWTAVGAGATPANPTDPDRPGQAGAGAVDRYPTPPPFSPAADGALVLRVVAADWTPAPFAFAALEGVDAGAVIESEVVQPADFDGPARVRVAGAGRPELSVAGRPWTTVDTIDPGESLRLRQTASDRPAAARAALLTLGDVAVEWIVATAPVPPRELEVGLACSAVARDGEALGPWVFAAALVALGLATRRSRNSSIPPSAHLGATAHLPSPTVQRTE